MGIVTLKPGREKTLHRYRHPWVYSGAVQKTDQVSAEDLNEVRDASGATLGWGFYSPDSMIALRMVSYGEQQPVAGWLEQRLTRAFQSRRELHLDTDAYRLINAEGDFLPGLVVDVYNKTVVVRPLIKGIETAVQSITGVVQKLFPDASLYLKRDERASRIEKLKCSNGYLHGSGDGTEIIRESDISYHVHIERGQKTGFYLDQRDNRSLVRHLAGQKTLLNLFAYTGAFALQAAAGGAQVVSVESSDLAVETARRNTVLNSSIDPDSLEWIEGDALQYLTECPCFDLIVADPPPYARRKADVSSALRGYERVNQMALAKLNPGGLLMTFSCSGAIKSEDLNRVVQKAARQANRQVQVLQQLHAAPDHPTDLHHPEGEYLKGILLRAQ